MMKLLLVGIDSSTAVALEKGLRARGHPVCLVAAPALCQAEAACHTVAPDLLLVEPAMPDDAFLDLLGHFLERFPDSPVVVLATKPAVSLVVKAIKLGAFDFVARETGHVARLIGVVERTLERNVARSRAAVLPQPGKGRWFCPPNGGSSLDAILGESLAIAELKQRALRIMNLDLNVLIRGETGTGKELLARAIHQGSPRRDNAFVPVNCAALAPELVESELFGHEKGAFTGACSRRVGKVMEADRGTLFLDEVGDLPAPMQAKLLRLLQEGEVQRVGADRPVFVDVRVLAATNQPLELLAGKGMFRSDLYHRLNAISLTIPPLRERGDDIVLLARVLIKRFAVELEREPPRLSSQAEAELLSHAWSGNFRELENVIRRELLFCEGEVIRSFGLQPGENRDEAGGGTTKEETELLDVAEGDRLAWLLRRYRGNLSRVARHLRISRPTAYKRLQAHGLKLRDFR